MGVRISRTLAGRLRAFAAAAPDREVCGLMFGTPDVIAEVQPTANVADDPRRRFEIDPASLIAALRAERAGGPRLIGHYHSHPSGPAAPSPCDRDAARGDGALWIILGQEGVRAWRSARAGTLEPVALLIAPD